MAFPMVARDEIDQTASFNSNTSSFSSSIGGTLRRSLRQINPFKTRLFRLPATPRLTRAKKGLSRGEETTNWNFERPLSTCGSVSIGPQNGQMYASIMSTAQPDSLSATVGHDSPAYLRHLKPPGEVGGSCRVRTRHTRPPLPSYNKPPDAKEAEDMIHEHIQNLMVTSSPRPLQRQFLYLPETAYASNGEMYNANWKRTDGRCRNDQPPVSPTHSTVSLLNTGRQAMRSMSYGAKDEPVHRPHYHLNGLFHQPSLRSLVPSNEMHSLSNSNKSEPPNQLLFGFTEFSPDNSEVVFLGREWIFKELHQSVLIEQNAISLIRGGCGSGKTAIMKQLALHSRFYSNKQGNGDTVDSGIVIGSEAESTISSRNYEYLRTISNEICALHECALFDSSRCSVPEFVRNIATHLMSAPSLREYSNIVHSDKHLMNLIHNADLSLLCSPVELFRRLIVEPLCQVDINRPAELECAIILIDAIDEAEFHRNESGESIGWLIKNCHSELPKWVRWVLSASNENLPFAASEARSIWIDNDVELDERVARDMRLLVDYRIAVNPSLGRCLRERSSLVDEIVKRAKGNALFITILLDMIEQDRIQMKSIVPSLLPSDITSLYLLYFNSVFNSLQQFHSASIILSVVLSSLRPLSFDQIYNIINSGQSDVKVSIKDLEKRLLSLQPFITKLNSGAYVLIHNSLRDWVLNGSNHTDYLVNVRYGHILHALYFVNQPKLSTEQLYELGHHLLKANPAKYMDPDMAPNMPCGRDSQIQWLQMAARKQLETALLYERNIYYPNSKVTRLLLMAGASTRVILPDKDTLLCKYASAGNNTMIELLLQYNADVNASNQTTGLTPLMYAIRNRHLQSVQLLLQNGADISAKDLNQKSALIHAASSNSTEIFALIFDTDWQSEEEQSVVVRQAFHEAIQSGNIHLCKYILDTTDISIDLSTSLMVACCSGSVNAVQFLLSKGATLKVDQKWDGKPALLCVVQSGLFELTNTLLNTPNLKINTEVSSQGYTPLIIAAKYGHVGLIELLLNKGSFIDAADLEGLTAIAHSIISEHFSIASLLIKKGCNVEMIDNQGNTLLHHLALHYNKGLIERLLELGLQVDAKNSNGLRAVELAIMSGNKQNSVDLFLKRGARLRSITWQIAATHNPDYIVTLIDKLFNDGRTLHRRNRMGDALQRFNHALQKCNEFLQNESSARFMIQSMNASIKSIDSINNNQNGNSKLGKIRPQLRFLNCQILHTLATINLQNGDYNEALNLTAEALCYADSEPALFQLHLFRAKCFFDNRDLRNARASAQFAASLRPDNKEVQIMLSSLTTSSPLEF